MPTDASYTITDLARLAGLSPRTIRYWISQGLLPASGESGPGAHYGQGHLDRLQLIKRLQAEFLPNAEIRRRITALSDAEVAEVLREPAAAPAKQMTSALEYVRGVLGAKRGEGESASPIPMPRLRDVPPRAPAAMLRLSGQGPEPPATSPDPPPAVGRIVQLREAPAPMEPASEDESKPSEPKTPERSQWERLSLSPDIELHVRRPLSRIEQRRVERLITIARQVLGEDQS